MVKEMEIGRLPRDMPNEQNELHQEYGKVPRYIEKFKTEQDIQKEKDKVIAEEKNFPPGTKLLSEDERISTLIKLQETKKSLLQALDKLPLSLKTLNLRNKKIDLDKRLSEVETAISTFSRKKVFIKSQ